NNLNNTDLFNALMDTEMRHHYAAGPFNKMPDDFVNGFNSLLKTLNDGVDIFVFARITPPDLLQTLNKQFFQGKLSLPKPTEMDSIILNYEKLASIEPKGQDAYNEILKIIHNLGSGSTPEEGATNASHLHTALMGLFLNKDPTF